MDLINLILRKDYCSRCSKLVSKSEFKEDKHRIKYNICKKCQQQLKNSVRKPKAFWKELKHWEAPYDTCIYCGYNRIKRLYGDPFDHTGDIYKCKRCRSRFMGYQLDDSRERKEKKARKKYGVKRPKPTKQNPIAQLKCRMCDRVFRQDNRKFRRSGRCPSCGYFEFELMRYLPKRKK